MTRLLQQLRGSGWSSALAMGLVLVLGVVATEVFFRQFEPFWDRLAAARFAKMSQYDAVRTAGQKFSYVFIGSSTTFMGIDPDLIDAETGKRSYNAGQLGYTEIGLNIALAQEIIDARITSSIVLGVDSWIASLPPSDRAVMDRHGRSDHFLWLSNVFRNRAVVAFWARELVRGNLIWPAEAWRHHLRSSRRFQTYEGVALKPTGYLETYATLDPDWPDYARPLEINAATEAGLQRLIRMCVEAGVRPIIVRPPEFERTFRENRAIHEQISQRLVEIAKAEGASVIDFFREPLFTEADAPMFMDIHHVNHLGARLLSIALGQRLRALD